jgi:hypothetical protein
MNTLDKLAGAIAGYLELIRFTPAVQFVAQEEKKPNYSGIGFAFEKEELISKQKQKYTALMVDIDKLFSRVYLYTSQKSRFIRDKEGNTDTDLFTFSPDESNLYLQFLKDGSDELWKIFIAYAKQLAFKGYLFDEGVDIIDSTEDDVKLRSWDKGSFVRVNERIYEAVDNIPAGTDITNEEFWNPSSNLYDTKGKVVFIIIHGNYRMLIPDNALLLILKTIEDCLYAYVLWRWYTMAEHKMEAELWYSKYSEYQSVIRVSLSMRTRLITRSFHPF